MFELQDAIMQTPIEIALGIDENGMTTAKRLYDFLELAPGNYARWCKSNIIENAFAENGSDYYSSQVKSEGKGNFAEDYKLTARFAKKLSMMQKNQRGEDARDYFASVEDGMKSIAGKFKSLSPELQAIFLHDEKIQEVDSKVEAVKDDLQHFKQDLPILGVEESKITSSVRRKGINCLGGKESSAYMDKSLRGKIYSDIYGELKRQFGVTTYKAIKRSQCDLAVGIIENYEPPIILQELINDCNAQLDFGIEVA